MTLNLYETAFEKVPKRNIEKHEHLITLELINIVINYHHHLLTRYIKNNFNDKEYHNCSVLAPSF